MPGIIVKSSWRLSQGLFVIVNASAESPEWIERRRVENFDLIREAPADNRMAFEVFVFRDAGWNEGEVNRVIVEASEMFALQCRFDPEVSRISFIHVDSKLHRINNQLQEQLLANLGDIKRPAVFLLTIPARTISLFMFICKIRFHRVRGPRG